MPNIETFFKKAFKITGYNGDADAFLSKAYVAIILNSTTQLLETTPPEKKESLIRDMERLSQENNSDYRKSQDILKKYFNKNDLDRIFKGQTKNYVMNYFNAILPALDDDSTEMLAHLMDEFLSES